MITLKIKKITRFEISSLDLRQAIGESEVNQTEFLKQMSAKDWTWHHRRINKSTIRDIYPEELQDIQIILKCRLRYS